MRTSYQFDPNYLFDQNEGLRTPFDSDREEYTIALSFSLAELDPPVGGYGKLIDFKNGTVETGLYVVGPSGSAMQPGSIALLNYVTTDIVGDGVLTEDVNVVVVTRDAAGLVRLYVAGEQIGTFDDAAHDVFVIQDAALFFIDDSTVPEYSSGACRQVRLYDRALTTEEVKFVSSYLAVA